MSFQLNKTLEQDSIFITDLKLCQLRLINNSDFPWVILVPRLPDIIEITDLAVKDFSQLTAEIHLMAQIMQSKFKSDKLNIAIIGNVVTQMHVHIVARYKNDKLYPKTVWGYPFSEYKADDSAKIVQDIKQIIEDKQL
ncbi:MAG: HIT domain-containing protein [Rickettsiaceae bacterium]